MTVDGVGSFSSTAPYIDLFETDTTDLNSRIVSNSSSLRLQTVGDDGSGASNRLLIDHSTGDISFYEDTGSTAKFFWDASAERLGIGTTSPEHALHVNGGTANTVAQFQSTDANAYIEFLDSDAGASGCFIGGAGDDFVVLPNASEKFRVTSSGNVGIKTSSPANLMHIEGSSAVVSATQLTLEGRFAGYGAGIDFVSRTSSGGTRLSMAKITADGEAAWNTTAA